MVSHGGGLRIFQLGASVPRAEREISHVRHGHFTMDQNVPRRAQGGERPRDSAETPAVPRAEASGGAAGKP